MSIVEEIHERSKSLPEPLAREVLDFLLFLSTKQEHSQHRPSPAYSSRKGAWKGRLSSSEAFARAKTREIELEG
jgi:hypothetical protein